MIHGCNYSWVCLRLGLQMPYAKEHKHVWLHRKLNGKSCPLVSPWFDVCLIGKLKRFVRLISIFSVKVLFWTNSMKEYKGKLSKFSCLWLLVVSFQKVIRFHIFLHSYIKKGSFSTCPDNLYLTFIEKCFSVETLPYLFLGSHLVSLLQVVFLSTLLPFPHSRSSLFFNFFLLLIIKFCNCCFLIIWTSSILELNWTATK